MRRRIFWGLAAATAALAIVAGAGTFGFFSSTRVNPGNAFAAGRLVLSNDRDGTFILTASNMQPGDTLSRQVVLSRAASTTLDMNYNIVRSALSGSLDADPTSTAFCSILQLSVTRTDAGQNPDDTAIPAGETISNPNPATTDTISSFPTPSPRELGSLTDDGNTTDTYLFTVTFVDTGSPQDEYQGATCTVEYTWAARQQASNDDLVTGPPVP